MLADDTVQLFLVVFLQPRLADVGGTAVVADIDDIELLLADATDIAHGVRRGLALGVMPAQARFDVDARETMAVHRQAGHLVFAEARSERNALERAVRALCILKLLDILFADAHDLAEALQRCVHVLDLLRDQLKVVGGTVLGQNHAVAVVDQAPVRRQRHQAHPVFLRQAREMRIFDDLQPAQPHQQGRDQQETEDAGDNGTRLEQPGHF